MGSNTLSVFADAVLQQVRAADGAVADGTLLITLPAYLDAAEVRLLQTEVNRRSAINIELQHRLGERRVGVRLALPMRRR